MNSSQVGYWRMTPANHLVSGDARNRFCLALEGEEYLVSGRARAGDVRATAGVGGIFPISEAG
ncbi:MAG: hypothetical protein L0Z50_30890 [Verrucomicrobiales bacterium]|nr:hypothetical protein [Verrucomicrobiales bacterium]